MTPLPFIMAARRSLVDPRFLLVLVGYSLLLLVALQALIAVPALMWSMAVNESGGGRYVFGLAVGVPTALLVVLFRNRLWNAVQPFLEHVDKIPRARLYVTVLGLGIGLRLLWSVMFQAPPTSDASTYVGLAEKLLAGEPYWVAGNHAYWPPGYPFFLYAWYSVFGTGYWPTVASNIVLYLGSGWVVAALAYRWKAPLAAPLAVFILSVWPAYLSGVSVPQKEQLITLLLPLSFLLYTAAADRRSTGLRVLMPLGAGFVLGFGTLAQPSLQLFFLVFVVYELVHRGRGLEAALRVLLVVAGMILVIAPWSARNYAVFDTFVPITTNGGSNFYRANNPLATGGWMPRGEHDLAHLSELEANRKGYELGMAWIREHPGDFLRLALWKQLRLLGDDTGGFYDVLRRGLEVGGPAYPVFKGLANLFWIGLWALFVLALVRRGPAVLDHPATLMLVFAFLYFWGIHSIFESSGKYHQPAYTSLALLLSMLWTRAPGQPAERNPDHD